MLCPTCTSIDFDELIPPATGPEPQFPSITSTQHHESLADLVAAAASGCRLCAVIEKSTATMTKQAASQKQLMSVQEPVYLTMSQRGRAQAGYQGCSELWVNYLGMDIAQLEVYVPTASILANKEMKLISGRPVSVNPASEECFALATSWIQDCRTSREHIHCPKVASRSSISALSQRLLRRLSSSGDETITPPTRLIDIGPSSGSQEPKLVLSSDSKVPVNPQYVALSHRWGQSQPGKNSNDISKLDLEASAEGQKEAAEGERRPVTTTSQTLEQRMKKIPMATFPRTFRDAITLTRGLGVRYLWIDSLCIIQDSKSDWDKEAAQMANIYKNSYVTIAAESSRDSHMGMFHERVLDFEPIELPFKSKIRGINASKVYLRLALDDWETCLDGPKNVLRSRAWALQESLLAPRIVRIGSQQMFWECMSRSLAEGNVAPIAPSKERENPWDWSQSKRFLARTRGVSTGGDVLKKNGLSREEILYLQWFSIIRDYSSRDLSFPSDVFAALEGLAREFNARLNDKYIAGLWKRDLLRGLLWIVEGSNRRETAREARPYRAPSWSWAAITDGRIRDVSYYGHRVGDYHVEVIDVNLRLAGGKQWTLNSKDNHYGEIRAGTMTLRGRWAPCSRWPRFEENYYDIYYAHVRGVEEGFGRMVPRFDSPLEELYEARHRNGRTLSLLEIATWVGSSVDIPVVYFLILESGDAGDESVFKRVGVVTLYRKAKDLDDRERWVKNWEVKQVTIA